MPIQYESYTNIFGGNPVQPAYVGYETLQLNADIQLAWPTSYLDSPQVVATIMDVTATSAPDWVVQLPDATQVSNGTSFIINNRATNAFILSDFDGNQLITIDP